MYTKYEGAAGRKTGLFGVLAAGGSTTGSAINAHAGLTCEEKKNDESGGGEEKWITN